MMGYGAGLGFGFGGLLALLGCVLLVASVVALIAWAIGRGGQAAAAQSLAPKVVGPDALDTLRLRFARGEISTDEFNAMRQTLEARR